MEISEELGTIVSYARDEAMRTGCPTITTDHLILGLIRHQDNEACQALATLGISLVELKDFIDAGLSAGSSIPFCEFDKIRLSRDAQNTINMAMLEASMSGDGSVCPRHLILAACRTSGNLTTTWFKGNGISRESINKACTNNKAAEPSPAAIKQAPTRKAPVFEIKVDADKIYS